MTDTELLEERIDLLERIVRALTTDSDNCPLTHGRRVCAWCGDNCKVELADVQEPK